MLGALLLAGMALGDQTVELPRDETKSLIDAHAKAREKIDEAFAGPLDVQALMCTPPSLVGFVQKSENLQIPDSFDPTDIELDRFRAARVPIFDSCQVRLLAWTRKLHDWEVVARLTDDDVCCSLVACQLADSALPCTTSVLSVCLDLTAGYTQAPTLRHSRVGPRVGPHQPA